MTRPSHLFSRKLLAPALGALAGLLTWSADAGAHGGTVRAFEMVLEPGNASDVVLRSDVWGFFRTRDGGKSWQWSCAETYGGDSISVGHVNMALAPGGRMFVANTSQGLRYTDDGCAWQSAPDFDGLYPIDVKTTADAVYVESSLNTSGDAGVLNTFYRSTDGGNHFAPMGAPLPNDYGAKTFAFAPSDPTRLYVTGRVLNAPTGTLFRSDDGGDTWQSFSIPTTDPFMSLRIIGIHPTRPDLLFVWGDLAEELYQDSPDELWATTDGGAHFQKVYQATGDLPGFAFSPDGTELVIAGPKEGLMHANLDDALANGQSAFSQMLETTVRTQDVDKKVWGLHWDASGLTGGLDNFTRQGIPAMIYGLWSPKDSDFTELMDICQPTFGTCAASSTVSQQCTSLYTEPLGYEDDYLVRSGRCPGIGGAGGASGSNDGGVDWVARPTPPSTPPKSKSGGCNLGDAGGSGAGPSVLSLMLAAVFRKRRRANT